MWKTLTAKLGALRLRLNELLLSTAWPHQISVQALSSHSVVSSSRTEACNIRPAGHNPARGTGLRGPHILGQVSHHF